MVISSPATFHIAWTPGCKKGFFRWKPKNKTTIHVVGLRSRAKSKQKLFVEETFRRKWSCFFGKTGHVATSTLEQRRTVDSEWYTTMLACSLRRNSKKRTREHGSLCTMTMQALTHQLKPTRFWPAKMSNWWLICRTALTSFYYRTPREKWVKL